jgi:hypothetical protein
MMVLASLCSDGGLGGHFQSKFAGKNHQPAHLPQLRTRLDLCRGRTIAEARGSRQQVPRDLRLEHLKIQCRHQTSGTIHGYLA